MSNPTRPPRFISKAGLLACISFAAAYVPLVSQFPDLATVPDEDAHEPDPTPLTTDGPFGNITSAEVVERNGKRMVAVSIQGRNPRFFDPLDFLVLKVSTGFGLSLTIQKTSKDEGLRRDYPRISSPGPGGYVFQVLRIITDAKPGDLVKQRSTAAGPMDHHYLGRDGLLMSTDAAERDAGKKLRHTSRGRPDLIMCAMKAFETNGPKVALPEPFSPLQYAALLELAFSLADWRHGRLADPTSVPTGLAA